MKDILIPIITGFMAFMVGFLGYKSKGRETKVNESGVVLKGYNELLANHELEFKRMRDRIAELEDDLKEEESDHSRTKIAHMKYIQERLREH